jgi:predicted phosphoadenosine phosphosulfate sulfurtransferase
MIARVPGATTAARYARTELYGFGGLVLPPGKTWRRWFDDIVSMWRPAEQRVIRANVAELIRLHVKKTRGRAVPHEVYDPLSGASWKFFCELAVRGDLKGRRSNSMQTKGEQTRKKASMTLDEALAEVEQ